MIIFLAIIVLFVLAVFLTIKYLKINVRVLGGKNMQREAAKRAGKLRSEDPVISCDYCGAKFDTSQNSVCPVCGADFSRDEEWLRRFNPDKEWVQTQSDEMAEQALSDAGRQSAKTAANLKKVMIILSSAVGVAAVISVISIIAAQGQRFEKNEELNRYNFENYTLCEYQLNDGGVVFSQDGLTVTATLYEDNTRDPTELKIGFRVQNETDIHKRLTLDVCGINGLSGKYLGSTVYGLFKKNSDVTVYNRVFQWDGGPVREILFGGLKVQNDEDWETLYEDTGLIRMTTTAPDTGDKLRIPAGDVIYSDHGVDVIRLPAEKDYLNGRLVYTLWIINETEYNYSLTIPDIIINGQPQNYGMLYKEMLPAGYVFECGHIFTLNEEWEALTESDKVETSLSFVCADHPEADFSTGYLYLQGEDK